jgi:Domain of unknown function (DUF3850)
MMLQVETRQMEPGRAATPDDRGGVEHKVKSWPHLFEAALAGTKTHEMRKATERDYRVGDTLRIQEYDPSLETYTGRELVVRITYITSSESPCALSRSGLHPDYCILSITKLP